MIPKSYRGKVFGAELTAAERKAMNIEITRQLIERDKKYQADIDALILYVLMSYGCKKKRLKQFWKRFVAEHKKLREFFEMDQQGDSEWLAHRMLREIGVDVHQWYKEEQDE